MLTMQAIKRGNITVLGGKQIRPNIHINDLVDVYLHFLKKSKLPSGPYNAGFENLSIIEIARKIKKITNAKIVVKKSNDPRSYRQSSKKLLKTGFIPKYNIENAINDIIQKYSTNKKIEDICFTVKWMKKLRLNKMKEQK